jgi:hypothetical protein
MAMDDVVLEEPAVSINRTPKIAIKSDQHVLNSIPHDI